MRKIRLKPTESYCQKYLYTKIMTSKCKIIKYKLNANIFFQIYFCSTFSVRIQKVKINWKGRRLFERRHSKNTIWCESTYNSLTNHRSRQDITMNLVDPIMLQVKMMNMNLSNGLLFSNFYPLVIENNEGIAFIQKFR